MSIAHTRKSTISPPAVSGRWLSLPTALLVLLVCSVPARASLFELSGPVAALIVGQKSVLDDFDEEVEEPVPQKPPEAEEAPPKKDPPPAEEIPAEEEEAPPKEEMPEEEPAPAKEEAPAGDDMLPGGMPGGFDEEEEAPAGANPFEDLDQAPGDEEPGAAQEEQEEEAERVCDRIRWQRDYNTPRVWVEVMLFHYWINGQPPFAGGLKVARYSEKGKGIMQTMTAGQIKLIEYYEERMGNKAAELLNMPFAELASPGKTLDLSKQQYAEAADEAEKILITAIAEHDSAVQRRLRRDERWTEKVRTPLVQARLNIRLNRVDLLIRRGNFAEAEMECDRLSREIGQASPVFSQLRSRIDRIFSSRARAAMAKADYATVRDLIDQLANKYPGEPSGEIKEIQEELISRATELVRAAESVKDSSPKQALQLLEEAGTFWPPMAQIDLLRRQMATEYPVLRCAYSDLPRNLSPVTACSQVERHAVSLIFESLVRWVDNPMSGYHYECQLAARRPDSLVLGRDFRLQRTCWSDSTDAEPYWCMVDDVRGTLKILRDPDSPGYSPAWSSLFKGVDTPQDGDYLRALIRLSVDHWQPLSLMDFRILPGHCLQPTGGMSLKEQLDAFSLNPVGTGPYRLALEDNNEPDALRFEANPYYRVEGLPAIREIVFHRMDPLDAKNLFMKDELHMIVGVQKEHVNQLGGKRVVRLKTPTVTFLAPNYRRKELRNANLRLAIAHAIDRKEILKQYFRSGGTDHAELNGPYPKDSWANDPSVSDFNSEAAKLYFQMAREELSSRIAAIELTLAYPLGNPDVESACKQIVTDVKKAIGDDLQLTLVPLESGQFYRLITENHNFDLAYWNHTYKDSTFWLEPLLDGDDDARRPGGLNFMGYVPDEDLADLFHKIKRHKQFREIQRMTHAIHQHVARTALIIPLWQLDLYVALSDRLDNVTLDPYVLFGNVEQWTLRPE